VDGFALLALVSSLAFAVVGAAVGVKLLWLARTTKGMPERLIGGSLFLMSGVAWPLLLLVAAPGISEPALRGGMALAGLIMALGWSATFLFTWQVFRPGESWARTLAFAGIAVELLSAAAGAHRALTIGDAAALRTPSPAGLAMLFGALALDVWTALESFRYAALLRRRVPLGLADPLVADRVQKWGWTALFGIGSIAPALVTQLGGGDANTPAQHLVVGICGLASSIFLYFAFLPPAGYVRWVRQNAPSPEPGGGF
jgi:hypothetical protein